MTSISDVSGEFPGCCPIAPDHTRTDQSFSLRTSAYVRAAIDSELDSLRCSSSGRRCAAFRASAAIGGFVGCGAIDRSDAETLLLSAALETGLSEREAISHIQRGLDRGEMTPRSLPAACVGDHPLFSPSHQATKTAVDPAVAAQSLPRPPRAEIEALWNASVPISSDPEVAGWFCYRFCLPEERPATERGQSGDGGELCYQFRDQLCYRPRDAQEAVFPITSSDSEELCYRYRPSRVVEHIELWDLARAIPENLKLPRWAWSRGGSWTRTGHRILFRLWDHNGHAASVRVRCIDPTAALKSLAPCGFSVKGLVLADPLGVQFLSGPVPDWWMPRVVIISEGEVDWGTWVGRQGDAEAQGPACFGIEAGSWTPRIAHRIPDGSSVVLRTDHDEPGERYAAQIASTLRGRCRLFRSLPEGEAAR